MDKLIFKMSLLALTLGALPLSALTDNSSNSTMNPSPTDPNLSIKIYDQIKGSLSSRGQYERVNAQINNGVVTLTGSVSSENEKDTIEKNIRNLEGVRRVDSRLEVTNQSSDFENRGSERLGNDNSGYMRGGYDNSRFNRQYDDQSRYNRSGYDNSEYNHPSYDNSRFNRQDDDQSRYNRPGNDNSGYNRSGYDNSRYNRQDDDQSRYNRSGYDNSGYNRSGYDNSRYNRPDYDQSGYNRSGYDNSGYNRPRNQSNDSGYNRSGYDNSGYNQYDNSRNNRTDYDHSDYNDSSYDNSGFDRSRNQSSDLDDNRSDSEKSNIAEKTNTKFAKDTFSSPSDQQLNRKIRDQISKGWIWDSYEDVILKTSNGNITLDGKISSKDDEQKLINEIQKIDGVKSVKSNLIIAK